MYWERNYTAWERNENENFYDFGGNVFDENPFYRLNHTQSFMPEPDGFKCNKSTVTTRLIRYLEKARNPLEANRDYYYFLVANCYYNMSFYGNAWMMNRFFRSSAESSEPNVEGDRNYHGCHLAKKYYLEALSHAKSDKFRALCLRMAGTCHERGLYYEIDSDYEAKVAFQARGFQFQNPYYQELAKRFPDDYEKLAGNCSYFEQYFRARP